MPPPPTPPPSQVIKLWCLIRVPDVCMYLFIWIFIVSLSSSLPPWVHSRNFKNIHGKATKIKDPCLVNSLQHVGLGQSLKWFALREQNESSLCPRRVLWNVLGGSWRTLQDFARRTHSCWSLSPLLSEGTAWKHANRAGPVTSSASTDSHCIVQSGWNALCSLSWTLTWDPPASDS